MSPRPMWLALLVLLVGAADVAAEVLATTHFDKFFPDWDPRMLQGILKTNCSTEYARYKTGTRPEGSMDQSAIISPLINCIFQNLTEHNKAEIAAGVVVLGLLPAILQTLGSKPPETAFLAMRRPVLALLLALGSPSVTVIGTNDFINTVKESVESHDMEEIVDWLSPSNSTIWPICLSFLEYVFAIAAAANIVYLAYHLGVHAITIISPETVYLLPLWTGICLIIYFGNFWFFMWKSRFDLCNGATPPAPRRLITQFREEFTPTAFQKPWSLKWHRPSKSSNAVIWFLSRVALANLIFGTMVFSSLLFFSIKDVMSIVGRYFASAVVCRGIVRLELSGWKGCMSFQDPTGRTQTAENGRQHDQNNDSQNELMGMTT
ncbi:hypothetical protein PspLS_12063 [Pyricularia sp. CBS 133598]|nr:hypothetical protein PspLS_12063 [Pyricularia sp. CBS 133598]